MRQSSGMSTAACDTHTYADVDMHTQIDGMKWRQGKGEEAVNLMSTAEYDTYKYACMDIGSA